MMKKYVKFVKGVRIERFLKYNGYFRVSRYAKYVLSLSNIFQEKPSQDILFKVFDFDVKLRDIFFNYCRKAEIQFKSHVSNAVAISTNEPAFYLKKDLYTPSKGERDKKNREKNKKYFDKMFSRLKSDEKKLRTDKLRYPELNEYQGGGGRRQNKIPVWAFFSYIELGEFINIYGYLNLQYQKEILKYGYTRDKYTKEVAKNVDTWLNAIRNLRNVCAHHAKLVGIKSVEIATENSEANILISKEDLLSRMYALKKILNENDAEQLKIDVKKLISKTKIEVYRMEILPEDWEERYDRINNL